MWTPLLVLLSLSRTIESTPLYDSYDVQGSHEKLFSSKQIKEIQGILDSAAQGDLAHNLTVIEVALQNFLLEKTNEDSKVTVDGILIPQSELNELHTKLDKVGKLLRDSLDLSGEGDGGGLAARFESGEHAEIAKRNQETQLSHPRHLAVSNAPSPAISIALLLTTLIYSSH